MTRSKPATTRAVGKSEVDFLAPPKRDDEIGRLGPYRVLSRIGSGGMGMVFRAEDPALKRQVALKVMLPHCALNPRRKARFLREAHAQAHVEHEHVVAIFQAGEVDGVAFIAMPLLKGQTLSSALSQNPRPPLREVLRIGREMAEGLAAAHEAGLIHRDIKPPNVWLDGKRRRVKILDFGLARSADSTDIGDSGEDSHPSGIQEDGALTVQGAVLGTPLYMSPEQARGEKADHRTDLFSLGIVLYQMTTGKLPFTGSCTSEILSAVKELQPLDPRALNPDVPQAVADFIMQLLAKPVAERPASAEEVAETLQRLEGALTSNDNDVVLPALALDDPWRDLDATEPSMLGEPLAPMPVAPRTLKAPRAWKRGSIFIIAGVATVLVGVLVFIVDALFSKRPQPQPEPETTVVKGAPAGPKPTPVKKAFAWPAEALRDSRIPLLDLSTAKLLKADEFDDRATGWPQGKVDIKGAVTQRGYQDGTYFIHKEFDGGVSTVNNAQWGGLAAFVCQVEGRVVDDAAANWELCLGNDSQRKVLTVKLNAAGKLTVGLGEPDSVDPEPLFSGTHAAIRKGNEFNKLTVIDTAERLEVFVNGVAVCDPLTLPIRLPAVNVGLGLSGGGKCTAEFRRLMAWSAEGLPSAEERLKTREVPVKEAVKIPFAWPVTALREGRISLPQPDASKLIKADLFNDPVTAWPQGRSENKGIIVDRGYKSGIYFIRKQFDAGWSYVGSGQFNGLSTFVCQVEARVVDDMRSNLDVWFGNDAQRKGVTVRLNSAGKLKVAVMDYDKGDLAQLYSGTHAVIKKGSEFNALTLIYTGDRLEVFVNGIAVCDPLLVPLPLQPVRLGMGMSSGGKSTVEFRRLSVWSLDALPTIEERLAALAAPSK
jgi:serine/threonine protein kinase